MRVDSKLTGFVLKRQQLGEADLLVTWFTREQGKLRTVAAAGARSGSRLSFGLNPGFEASLRVVGRGSGSMYKLAGVTIQQQLLKIEDETRMLALAWLLELVLRSTPDEEGNVDFYDRVVSGFKLLNSPEFSRQYVHTWQFFLGFSIVEILGWSLDLRRVEESSSFFGGNVGKDRAKVEKLVLRAGAILESGGQDMFRLTSEADLDKSLAQAMNDYIGFQLDRKIHAKNVGDVIMELD